MFKNSEKNWNIKPRTFGQPQVHVPHPCLPSAIPCKFHTTFQHSTFILKTSYIYACITMKSIKHYANNSISYNITKHHFYRPSCRDKKVHLKITACGEARIMVTSSGDTLLRDIQRILTEPIIVLARQAQPTHD